MKAHIVLLAIGVCIFLAAAPSLAAVPTVRFTPSENPGDPTYRDGGGELWTHIVSGSLAGYGVGDSFVTFCVEIQEDLDFVSPALDAVINPGGAIEGGVGGNPDPISEHTAWLYDQFINKSLTIPYEYDGSVDADFDGVPDREETAITLQNVFWGLEDELLPEGLYYNLGVAGALKYNFGDGELQQEFFDLAHTAVGGGWTNVGLIQVVNIYEEGTYETANPIYKQDILIRVPAPGAIGLSMFGIGMICWLRRRRAM